MHARKITVVMFSWVIIAMTVLAAVPISAEDSQTSPAAEPSEILIWEAVAKGYATVVSGSNGGLSYIISNSFSLTSMQ